MPTPAKSSKSSKTTAARRQRVAAILPILKQTYPDARCSLDYTNPLELLVATILSAQCTDERVNLVTPSLFKKYPSAKDYAAVEPEELEKDIQSTGFYRNKTKSLRGMGAALVERHAGKVPATMEELVHLPGVGRKTANVVLGNAFDINVGVVVDTHVTRVSNRLGLTSHAVDAVKIEQDLVQIVPRDQWTLWSHLLIHHGRQICQARKPRCPECPLLPHCPAGPKFIKAEEVKAKKMR
ncbi:MAG TPA: endonuclease III [Tepidisphaeraceae bacterium]|nr:endonuclease III [Tepidisphaeraceae bacterium]